MTKDELIEEIAAAFPKQPIPDKGIADWADMVGEDMDIRDQLAGRSWDSISPSEI